MIVRWGVVVLFAIAAVVSSATAQQYFNNAGGSGLVGKQLAVDFNAIGDTAVTINAARYLLRNVFATNCTAIDNGGVIVGGVYTEPAGAGIQVGSLVTAIVDSTNPPNHPTLAHQIGTGLLGPDGQQLTFTAAALYVRVTTPRGAAMTCDVYVIADTLP